MREFFGYGATMHNGYHELPVGVPRLLERVEERVLADGILHVCPGKTCSRLGVHVPGELPIVSTRKGA